MEPLYTQIERVSKWIVNLRYEDIPGQVIYLAKLQLLDCLSAICAGSRSTVGVRLKTALQKIESGGHCTLLPDGERWSMDNVLYYHAAMINALELDHFLYMGHVGQSTISSSLAIGEIFKLSGRDTLLSLIAADEVSGRIAAHLFSGPLQGHMRSFIHRSAGATVVSKLLGFTERDTAKALSISLSMPELPLYPACFSPDTKVICPSSPTVEGVKAAFMAQAGMDGPFDIIENPAGFLAYFSYTDKMVDIWRWIGESSTLYTLCVKNFATCGYAQGPVTAAIELRKSHEFSLEEVDRINIYAPLSTLVMEKFSKPHYGASVTPVNTHFSTIRSVTAALAYGELTGDFYRYGNFENKAGTIMEHSKKGRLIHDWPMTINLVKKIDCGLVNAGKYGFLCLRSSEKTLDRFKKAFGSRSLFSWRDVREIAGIPFNDQFYFIKRYLRAFSGHYGKSELYADADNSYSHEGDLSKMTFPMSGRVEVVLKNGKKLASECTIPSGYNPDEREQTIRDKYLRETIPVWGEKKAHEIMKVVLDLENYQCSDLFSLIRNDKKQME
jgi:2-methylcitrate dehydratase PrpD